MTEKIPHLLSYTINLETVANHDDGDAAVLLLEPPDMTGQLERLLIVAVPHACVHELRHLQDLQQLRVPRQRHVVHPPTQRINTQLHIFIKIVI